AAGARGQEPAGAGGPDHRNPAADAGGAAAGDPGSCGGTGGGGRPPRGGGGGGGGGGRRPGPGERGTGGGGTARAGGRTGGGGAAAGLEVTQADLMLSTAQVRALRDPEAVPGGFGFRGEREL